jgi:hypothetical protein
VFNYRIVPVNLIVSMYYAIVRSFENSSPNNVSD